MPLAQEPRATLSIPEWRVLVFFQLFGFFAYINATLTWVCVPHAEPAQLIPEKTNQSERAEEDRQK